MNTVDIQTIAEIVADEKNFESRKGPRLPDRPSFIFFDDEREEDESVRWARELALDFEEWNAARSTYRENEVPKEFLEYLERQDQRAKDNWLIQWHKRKTSNNDHWRTFIMPLLKHLEDPKIGKDCRIIVKALSEALPEAPRAIGGTVFVNPDGTRHETAGTDIGRAKASYAKRHNLDGEFISVERVQKEGEKFSKFVVGTRKTSDVTISSYYDPNPSWSEKRVHGEWVKAYQPSATNLYRVGQSMVMPSGSHRLTVREFEQCIIAGAETFEDYDDAMIYGIENSITVDDRVRITDHGYGEDGRAEEALCEEESYLYGLLRRAGHLQACELMQVRKQEPGILAQYFHASDNPTCLEDALISETEVGDILKMVMDEEGWRGVKKLSKVVDPTTGAETNVITMKMSQPKNVDSMMPYVLDALIPEKTIEWEYTDAKGMLSGGDTDGPSDFSMWCMEDDDTIHTGPTGRRKPAHHAWS